MSTDLTRINNPISILMFHSISESSDHYSIRPESFDRQIEVIQANFPIIRLEEISSALERPDPERKVVITFDDAFENFLKNALPILEKYKVPTTMFIPTGLIGTSSVWDSSSSKISERSIMTAEAIKDIARSDLIDIGSHSVDHVRMAQLTSEEMTRQAELSKTYLEALITAPVSLFAYPFGRRGDYDSRSETILKRTGYSIAVTASWGTKNSLENILSLRRISLLESDDPDSMLAKIEGRDDRRERLKEHAMFYWRKMKGTACQTS